MAGNQTTYWGVLSMPNPPKGAIPFVENDNVSIVTDVLNFMLNSSRNGIANVSGNMATLNVNTGGDFLGTDAINVYNHIDSYQVASNISVDSHRSYFNSTTGGGHTVSSSRGNKTTPLPNLSGDFIGQFSGWGWSNNDLTISYDWEALAGIYIFASGAIAGNVGGELHLMTKADGGAQTDRITLDNVGNLKPTSGAIGSAVSASLGGPNKGFGALRLNYTIAVGTGNVLHNTPSGLVNMAAGTASLAVTNPLVTANSVVVATILTADATAVLKNVVCITGQFTINLSANATATTKIGYAIIGTDS